MIIVEENLVLDEKRQTWSSFDQEGKNLEENWNSGIMISSLKVEGPQTINKGLWFNN